MKNESLCNEECYFNELIGRLLEIDLCCYDKVIKNICDAIVNNMPGIIFCPNNHSSLPY